MRIRAFHIDSFGMLRDVAAEGLPAGFAVFLGRNEAGKSTLLDFFRSTLTGYPLRPKDARERSYVSSGQTGGSLLLDTEQGFLRLARRPGVAGISLSDETGAPLDVALWDRLLGGVTREVYTSVYGFSLSELQNTLSLHSEGVRNALYGASFGMGVRSPGAALKRLDGTLKNLFKPNGSQQELTKALRDWEDIRKDIRNGEDAIARYDELAEELERTRQERVRAQADRGSFDAERRRLERQLGIWRQWEEWRLAGARLARLESIPATFPQDGTARLERALERQEQARRDIVLAEDRLKRIHLELETCVVDEALLACGKTLEELAERKASCRNALVAIPGLHASLERINVELDRELSLLGPDWTLERVTGTDRSLAFREAVERQATERQISDSTCTAAQFALEKTTQELEEARIATVNARQSLEVLPEPVADLDVSARETLKMQLARTEEALQKGPERERELTSARAEFHRALSHLHLHPRQNTAGTLEVLSTEQDRIVNLAHDVLRELEDLSKRNHLTEQARETERLARERFEQLQYRRDGLGDADRAGIDGRRSALRRLRAATARQAADESTLAEAEDRLITHMADRPGPESSPFLMGIGLLLGLTGGAALMTRQLLGIFRIELSPGVVIPLELWLGYLILVAGVAFLWAGMPRKRPEAVRHATVAEQIRNRQEMAAAKLMATREEARHLCGVLGLAMPEALTPEFSGMLDDLDAALDRERDQCVAGERMEVELETSESELASLQQQALRHDVEFTRKSAEVQTLRRKWHDTLMDFGVQSVPLPENAAAFFARADSARLLWKGVESLEKEVSEMEHQSGHLITLAREVLPIAFYPESWVPLSLVMDAVRAVLESCRQAELAAEERARSEEALRGAIARETHLEEARCECVAALERTMLQRQAACATWQETMQRIGLGVDLSPTTAREALEGMERIGLLENERSRILEAFQQQERERDALFIPLFGVMTTLGREPESDSPNTALEIEAWGERGLSLLDGLRHELETARQAASERAGFLSRLAEVKNEVRQARAVQDDAEHSLDWLLRMAGAVDPEDFLRRFAILTEQEHLVRRRDDLEDVLRLAYEDMQRLETVSGMTVPDSSDFGVFLETFAQLDKDILEARLADVSGRVVVLGDEETQLADVIRTLELRLEALVSGTSLSDLRLREAASSETLRHLSREWAKHALARYLISEAKRRFEQERQPEVIRTASALFASITGDKWTKINASLEDSSLHVLPANGEPLSPEQLSRGTQEQLYLALRLAHMRNHATQAAPLPVIMDDVLVNFDPERVGRTASALARLCEPDGSAPAHQVLFFTCHPHIAHRLQETIPGCVLYTMEQGRITQA